MLNNTQIVLNRLADADRVHQKEAGCRLLLRSLKYACGAILAGFTVDALFHLGAGWRLVFSLAMLAGVSALGAWCWHLAYVRRSRTEHIARFLETRDATLGSRLINLLQLNEQTRDASLSPRTRDLARQAVDNYAAGLRDLPMEDLAATDEVRRQFKRAAWVWLGFTAVLALAFRVTEIEVARFVDPFGDHPPYSFTSLVIEQPGPAGVEVPYGKGLIVKVKASGYPPKEIFLTSYPPGLPGQAVTLPMFDEGGVEFNQALDPIHTDLVVYAHTKDDVSESKQAHINVVLTPQVEKAFVQIAEPAYTGIKPQEKPYAFKDVQALEGSTVQFRLQSNRPLREGWLEITAGNQPPRRMALKKSADNEVTGSLSAAESGLLRFGLVDVDGIQSRADYEAGLTVTYDLPPVVHIAVPENDAFVAMDFKLQAQTDASDDYGLAELRLQCGINGVFAARVVKYDKIVLESRVTDDFNFADMGVHPGDVITLFAEAVDNAPQPHLTRSQTVHLKVISVEDYNNYLREQSDISDIKAKYADLNESLGELIQKQKDLGDAEQKLADQLAAADPKQRGALAQQLDSLIAQQNELNQKLNQQAERMENFVRKQPLYDVEQDLQPLLTQRAKDIRDSTQANDAVAKAVAQLSSPASGPRQLSPDLLNQLKKASDDQLARLGQTHEQTDKQIVRTLDDMSQMQELIKDFNLFESLYHTQQQIAQQAQAYNREGQLSREDQLALSDLAANENQVAAALDQLQDKLSTDAKAAETLFPKAAGSGHNLAEEISGHFMEPLAQQATSHMLAGDGEQSFQVADHLRAEMEKLFSTCQGGDCPSDSELDSYLRLQFMTPGNNFAQMSMSRKFGLGNGFGLAGGTGNGEAGSSGFAVMDGSNPQVLGNESFANNSNASRLSSKYGKGAGTLATNAKGQPADPDVVNGLNPVNRHSAANSSEAEIEEYNNVVDTYFKAITTKKEQPVNEKSN